MYYAIDKTTHELTEHETYPREKYSWFNEPKLVIFEDKDKAHRYFLLLLMDDLLKTSQTHIEIQKKIVKLTMLMQPEKKEEKDESSAEGLN